MGWILYISCIMVSNVWIGKKSPLYAYSTFGINFDFDCVDCIGIADRKVYWQLPISRSSHVLCVCSPTLLLLVVLIVRSYVVLWLVVRWSVKMASKCEESNSSSCYYYEKVDRSKNCGRGGEETTVKMRSPFEMDSEGEASEMNCSIVSRLLHLTRRHKKVNCDKTATPTTSRRNSSRQRWDSVVSPHRKSLEALNTLESTNNISSDSNKRKVKGRYSTISSCFFEKPTKRRSIFHKVKKQRDFLI